MSPLFCTGAVHEHFPTGSQMTIWTTLNWVASRVHPGRVIKICGFPEEFGRHDVTKGKMRHIHGEHVHAGRLTRRLTPQISFLSRPKLEETFASRNELTYHIEGHIWKLGKRWSIGYSLGVWHRKFAILHVGRPSRSTTAPEMRDDRPHSRLLAPVPTQKD